MRPITISFAATGPGFMTDPVVLDPYTNPQSLTVIANTPTSGGSGSLSIQASNNDPFDASVPTPNWTWVTMFGAFSNSGAVTPTQPVSAVITSLPRMIRFAASACVGNPLVVFRTTQGGLGGV